MIEVEPSDDELAANNLRFVEKEIREMLKGREEDIEQALYELGRASREEIEDIVGVIVTRRYNIEDTTKYEELQNEV